MSEVLLAAQTGRAVGSRSSRRLRREGLIPAVVYGHGEEPQSVAIEWTSLRAALSTDAGVNALITLDIDGSKQLSIVKDLQRHPVRRDVLSVDFLRIDADAEVEVEVPLVLTGEAKKVTQASGMVDQLLHALPILARPDSIPTEVVTDISDLDVGNSLRVGDIVLPENVRPAVDPETPFAVGVITRSTRELMRQEQAAEDADAVAEAGDDGGDAAESDDSEDS